MDTKRVLRTQMREARRAYVATLPDEIRALLFRRPPAAIAARVPEGAVVGLYHAAGAEAPTQGYAAWLFEHGRRVALPWFAAPDAAMRYRVWANPWDEALLARGPFGALQPADDAEEAEPALAFVPLVAFTADGHRLGQGGGHYDRWHEAHPEVPAIGLAWDCQRLDALPYEPHDHPLAAVVTPTRLYEVG